MFSEHLYELTASNYPGLYTSVYGGVSINDEDWHWTEDGFFGAALCDETPIAELIMVSDERCAAALDTFLSETSVWSSKQELLDARLCRAESENYYEPLPCDLTGAPVIPPGWTWHENDTTTTTSFGTSTEAPIAQTSLETTLSETTTLMPSETPLTTTLTTQGATSTTDVPMSTTTAAIQPNSTSLVNSTTAATILQLNENVNTTAASSSSTTTTTTTTTTFQPTTTTTFQAPTSTQDSSTTTFAEEREQTRRPYYGPGQRFACVRVVSGGGRRCLEPYCPCSYCGLLQGGTFIFMWIGLVFFLIAGVFGFCMYQRYRVNLSKMGHGNGKA